MSTFSGKSYVPGWLWQSQHDNLLLEVVYKVQNVTQCLDTIWNHIYAHPNPEIPAGQTEEEQVNGVNREAPGPEATGEGSNWAPQF